MNNRPRIQLQLQPIDKIVEILCLIVIAALWLLTSVAYNQLPDVIPVHFDATGQADGYGPKATLWMLPTIASALVLGLTILNKYPHIFNYPTTITPENALQQYTFATRMLRWIKLGAAIIFLVIMFFTLNAVGMI
jgi:uncharacterized membrane protein